MSSTFFGINVAYTGLNAQRQALDVISQNIANASDTSYHRQRIVMKESQVLAQSQQAGSMGTYSVGTGVTVNSIERIRDELVENRLRTATQSNAEWAYMTSTLQQIESVLGEPSDDGLQTELDAFWNAWQDVATTPDSMSIRSTLVETATSLCQRIQYVYAQMSSTKDDLSMATDNDVDQINRIGSEIARLNSEINAADTEASSANSLLDRRDALVSDLSQLVGVSQFGSRGSDFILSIGGRVLVQGDQTNLMTTTEGPNGAVATWESDGKPVSIQGGEMKAIAELRDNLLPGYLSQLDDFATTLVSQVNALHTTGKTMTGADGGDFFTAGSTAANISVDSSLVGNPFAVAASQTGAIGDGEIGRQIAQLKGTDVSNGKTINELYRALVGDIGGETSIALKQSEAHDLSYQQFLKQQQSVSGVSVDEEMTNMIKFQQAYNAASRVLTTYDEMLSVLIERTGTIGR